MEHGHKKVFFMWMEKNGSYERKLNDPKRMKEWQLNSLFGI
jgi:hypothetical protein